MDILTQRGSLYRTVLDLMIILVESTVSIGIVNHAEPLKTVKLVVSRAGLTRPWPDPSCVSVASHARLPPLPQHKVQWAEGPDLTKTRLAKARARQAQQCGQRGHHRHSARPRVL